jgi:hypothetical protein
MTTIAVCLWILSVLVPAWRLGRAQRALDDDELVRLMRAANSPLPTMLPILLVGAIGFLLIRVATPAYRPALAISATLLAFYASGLVLRAGYRRMEKGGVPRAYLNEWRIAQWASAALFLAGSAFAFLPYVAALARVR